VPLTDFKDNVPSIPHIAT